MSEPSAYVDRESPLPLSSPAFAKLLFYVYVWCTVGVVVIYGVRLYQDVPIHHSFLPLVGAVFASAIAFLTVLTLRIVVGMIKFEVTGLKLEGASGPIILWCICFLTVAYGLYLLGVTDVAKLPNSSTYSSCSAHDATKK
jgi:hypothetical protein